MNELPLYKGVEVIIYDTQNLANNKAMLEGKILEVGKDYITLDTDYTITFGTQENTLGLRAEEAIRRLLQ